MTPSLLHGLVWVIFAFTYIGLALGRYPWLVLDRAGIAVVGGIFMLAVGALDVHQAARSIDAVTILLLFGLMIFSAQLQGAGFYDAVGEKLTHLSAHPQTLLACLIGVSALLSALLANDIVCLAFTPILCAALLRGGRDPIPYLLGLATSSNIGSAATLIGNPQNMYIGSVAGLQFGAYLEMAIGPVVIGLGLCWVSVVVIFRRSLRECHLPQVTQGPAHDKKRFQNIAWASRACSISPDMGETPMLLGSEVSFKPQRGLIIKTLLLLGGLIVYFLLARGSHSADHRAIAAMAGAALLLISRKPAAAKLYARVDYTLILLFLGLFVVNGAMSNQHLTDQIFAFIGRLHIDLGRPVMLAAVTTVVSNIVSNVPAVLLLAPAIHSARAWYMLALISTFAGNLTLVGSIANLIVAEGARNFGVKISLWKYCLVGLPLTIVTVAIGTLWLVWI